MLVGKLCLYRGLEQLACASYLHGCHRQGKYIRKENDFFKVGKNQKNFVVGNLNLRRTFKNEGKGRKLKITWAQLFKASLA